MLHHSSSRHQRNRGSRIKTLLQVTLLVGVVVWLVYQVKHSYDKKNEYLDDTEDHLARDERNMFHGRKERVGSFGNDNVEKAGENSDVLSKPEEEKGGETVFEKENNDSHEDDTRNTERSEAEEVQASGAHGNIEGRTNDNEETSGHSEGDKHDMESNLSGVESKSEIHSDGDDEPENNLSQEENTGETNGTLHEEVAQSDESNSDQTNASSNGSDGEEEKKMNVDSKIASGSLSDDTKIEKIDHGTEILPSKTGNLPQNNGGETQVDAGSTTSDTSEHNAGGINHVEAGYEHESATSSGVASYNDEKRTETVMANEMSNSKDANSEEGSTTTEVSNGKAANMEMENSQGVSTVEAANRSSEVTKPENQTDGATETYNNSERKIEIDTVTNEEQNESQGGGDNSGSNGSNDIGPDQTGKTETQ